MLNALRQHWPVAAALVAAIGLLALVGAGGVGSDSPVWTSDPLGIPIEVWGAASGVVAAGLAAQLRWQARAAFSRERRFVEQAAELRRASAQLERLAKTDALTGVPNRREFFDALGLEYRRSSRYGHALSVLMIDLDSFKQVNDRYGHPAGDAVLSQSAAVIEGSLRESDVVARYGGEEFAVLLPETAAPDAAWVAEKLRLAFERHDFALPGGGASLRMTISVGVAGVPESGVRDDQALVARADEALYEAKRGGRNRCVAYSPTTLLGGDAA
jgi:diguanylate cyclase (GGDEF)-like protein